MSTLLLNTYCIFNFKISYWLFEDITHLKTFYSYFIEKNVYLIFMRILAASLKSPLNFFY